MINSQKFIISLTILSVLFLCMVSSTVLVQYVYPISQKDKKAKNALVEAIEETVDTKWSQIHNVNISKVTSNNTVIAYNIATPLSATTNCPINATFNQTKYVRLASVGDTDANSGTDEEFQMMDDCAVQIHIIPGDLWYNNPSEKWFDLAQEHGFTPENTNIAVGNHDSKGEQIKEWLGQNSTYNMKTFADGKVDICAINSNLENSHDKFAPTEQQISDINKTLHESDALYKICTIHHPFMTVKSTHPNNGAFDVFHPIFKSTGVSIVLQAHNHNYQRFESVDDILYLLTGTGTHDTGLDLYPLDSDNDGNGHELQRGKRVNGITIIDLQIDNPDQKHIRGWFINLDRKILDQFEK